MLFGFDFGLKKTEVFKQLAPWTEYRPPHGTIGGTELKALEQFTYLDCTISSNVMVNKETHLAWHGKLPF